MSKEEIEQKIHDLTQELAKLTADIMNLEESPYVQVNVHIVNAMGMAKVHTDVQIVPKEIAEELNGLLERFKEQETQESVEAAMPPTEQVDELLKNLKANPGFN